MRGFVTILSSSLIFGSCQHRRRSPSIRHRGGSCPAQAMAKVYPCPDRLQCTLWACDDSELPLMDYLRQDRQG